MSIKVMHTQQCTRLALETGECQPKSHTHNSTLALPWEQGNANQSHAHNSILALPWGQGNVNQSHTHTTAHSPCSGDMGMSSEVTNTQQHTRLALRTGECQPKSRTHNSTLALPWGQGNVNQSHTQQHTRLALGTGECQPKSHTHNSTLALPWGQGNVNQSHAHTTTTAHSPCPGDRGMPTEVTHTQQRTRLALGTGECQPKSRTHNSTLALPWRQGNVNQNHTHTTTHSPCPGDRGMSTKVTHTQQRTRLALETGECQLKSHTHNNALALPWRQGNVN